MTIFRIEFISENPEGHRAHPIPSPSEHRSDWEHDCLHRGHSQNIPPSPQETLDRPYAEKTTYSGQL